MSARSKAITKWSAWGALLALAAVVLAPFLYVVTTSLRVRSDTGTSSDEPSLFLPRGDGFLGVDWSSVGFDNFVRLFVEEDFGRALTNSIFLASVSSLLAGLFAAIGGYTLARYSFRAKAVFDVAVTAALVVPGALLLAPLYALLHRMGLLDSYTGLILPTLAPAFGVYLLRQATLSSVPKELIEAARIDGSGEIRTFFAIGLPLLRPMLSAFVLISFLGMWNNFMLPQILLQDPERFPLAVRIAQLRGMYGTDYGLLMAGVLVSILPVMILFLALQRDFISGLTAGAVKG